MVQGLVDYTDSEDETEAPLPKLPPLSMGDEGYKNEWLSFVYVPGMYWHLTQCPILYPVFLPCWKRLLHIHMT